MNILFLHGWNSVPGGVKPTILKEVGHTVINPALTSVVFRSMFDLEWLLYRRHKK